MKTKRNTIQRTLVLEAVRELKCHATADDIYRVVTEKFPSISRTTVYRDLNQLAEDGEIRKLETPGGPDRFDHILSDHYHVRCTGCGRFFDVEMAYMPDLAEKISNANGFIFSGHDIIFRGICPECGRAQLKQET